MLETRTPYQVVSAAAYEA